MANFSQNNIYFTIEDNYALTDAKDVTLKREKS